MICDIGSNYTSLVLLEFGLPGLGNGVEDLLNCNSVSRPSHNATTNVTREMKESNFGRI